MSKVERPPKSSRPSRSEEQVIASWLGRTFASGGTLALLAAQAASGSIRRLVQDKEKADTSRLDELRGMATKLYETFGNLKGPLMKAVQMASYVDLALPAEVQDILAKLQDSAPPMTPAVIDRVIRQELGAPPDGIFAKWSTEPFAAASIGQVHRAETKDGRAVAVKVQYPGIRDAFRTDLRNASLLQMIGGRFLPNLDSKDILDEIKTLLLEECDYRNEARNQERFRGFYENDAEIVIPMVFPKLSTERVLTTELLEGRRFQAFCDNSTQEERNHAGRLISRFAFESIFEHSSFNCDPHPGNYLFLPDNRIGFLDFGCVKTFGAPFVEQWKKLVRSVLEQDRAKFREIVEALRLAPKPSKFDFDYHFKAMLYLYRPWLHDEPFRYTRDYAAESMRVLLADNPNQFQTNMPRDFVFVNRLQWGLNSVLARLEAEANWRAMLLPLIYADGEERPPPFPPEDASASEPS